MTHQIRSLTLENDLLQVRILPEFGGKIVSLRSLRTGGEFILPPLGEYRHVSDAAEFSEHDGGGFDECLPSVSACESMDGEPAVADHGDLWRVIWHLDSEQDGIVLHADARSRPLRLTRRATLKGPSLVLEYDLENLSETATDWLWSAHPLLHVEAEDIVVLPDDVDHVAVEYTSTTLLKNRGSVPWPIVRCNADTTIDLSRVREKDGVTAHKLFAKMNTLGWGALYRNRLGQGLVIRFDPSALPYLGIWICLGAWPETGSEKQYTVALEPTTSNVDSLALALRNETARSLGDREHYRWRLEIELLGAGEPIDLEAFRTRAADRACH